MKERGSETSDDLSLNQIWQRAWNTKFTGWHQVPDSLSGFSQFDPHQRKERRYYQVHVQMRAWSSGTQNKSVFHSVQKEVSGHTQPSEGVWVRRARVERHTRTEHGKHNKGSTHKAKKWYRGGNNWFQLGWNADPTSYRYTCVVIHTLTIRSVVIQCLKLFFMRLHNIITWESWNK